MEWFTKGSVGIGYSFQQKVLDSDNSKDSEYIVDNSTSSRRRKLISSLKKVQ